MKEPLWEKGVVKVMSNEHFTYIAIALRGVRRT